MLPRFHLISATLLTLATMSEEDSPLETSPEPDAAPHLGIGRLALEVDRDGGGTYVNLDAALTSAVGGSLNFMLGGPTSGKHSALRRNPLWTDPDPTIPKWVQCAQRTRPEQRELRKARAKRKAKKGWA